MAQTENPTSSNFTSVVRQGLDLFVPVQKDGRLAQLHARFWRASIADERRDWWSNQTGEVGVGDNEIDTESFLLNFDIGFFSRSILWVRKDYVRIYDYCNRYYEDVKNDGQRVPPSVVITGQPGIGKTYWISYAVRRRLGEGMPFLWCVGGKACYLFVEEGVFETHQDHLHNISFHPPIWTFTDTNDTPEDITLPIAETSTLFNIVVTVPERDQWKNLTKATRIVIMNPWTEDEIFQAAHIHRVGPAQMPQVKELFAQYGGIPRICLDFLRYPDKLANHETNSKLAMWGVEARTLWDHISNAAHLSFSEFSHTIFMLKRTDLDDLCAVTVVPATPSIEIQLESKIRELQHAEKIQLYHRLASMKASRLMAGLVFESLSQSMLQHVGI